MNTLRSTLWWLCIAWLAATALLLVKVLLVPEMGLSTPLADPTIINIFVTMLLGSCAVLFFLLPYIQLEGVLALGLFAGGHALWRRFRNKQAAT
jgi:uncharacterized membrane protein YdcZ (DUF606 family)